MTSLGSREGLVRELEELRQRLAESEATLQAIRRGEVDALIVTTDKGDRVFTLEGADQPYRILVQSMNQGALTVSLEGFILYSNQQFARLVQAPLEGIPGSEIGLYIAAEDQIKLTSHLAQAKSSGSSSSELTLQGQDGNRLPVYVSSRSLMLGVPALSMIFTDLSEQKQSRERDRLLLQEHQALKDLEKTVQALRLSEERFRVALAGFPIVVSNQDRDLRYTWIHNPAGGLRPEDILGKRDVDFLSQKEARPLEKMKRQVLHTGQATRTEVFLKIRGDSARWFDLIVEPLRDVEGRVVGITCATIDITSRREAADVLEQSNRHKDEFLAMLGHELRNPLGLMRSAIEVLQILGAPEPILKHAREAIAQQVHHMTCLVDDLLDVSRISHGKIQLHQEQVDLVSLVRQTVESHAQSMREKDLAVHLELPPGPLWMRGDPVRLVQMFGNLVGNAIKFSDSGGEIEAVVEIEAVLERAVVRICDSGIGLEPKALAHLFEPFYQGKQALGGSKGGLGLGLALVKGLTELHGGRVYARSDGPGCGTQFVVELPVGSSMVPTVSRPSEAKNAKRWRILVVEDHVDAATMMRHLLQLLGHEVTVAHTGAEALERARTFAPEVVLCDIGLPDMDGYAVVRAFREDPALASITLVALTGYGRDIDAERALTAGFAFHLTKPVTSDRIENVLATLEQRLAGDASELA